MSIRYQRRINLGNGIGLNLSKSGMSTSYRGKYGAIGSKGFSIRTGIPGLSYRSVFKGGKKKKKGDAVLIAMLMIGAFVLVALIAWNLFRFLVWGISKLYRYGRRTIKNLRISQEAKLHIENPQLLYVRFSPENLDIAFLKDDFVIENLLKPSGTSVLENEEIAIISFSKGTATITANQSGKVHFFHQLGDSFRFGEWLYKIEMI